MKKVKRLIEVKRQIRLHEIKRDRAANRLDKLFGERNRILASFTKDEVRLYKERIERACR